MRKLGRDEFDQLIEPIIDRFASLLTEVLQLSGVNAEEIDIVELVGDATRTPIIQQTIQSVLGEKDLQRTMNSLECIASGAGLYSGFLAKQLEEYKVADCNVLPVNVTYSFDEMNFRTVPLFDQGMVFPCSNELRFGAGKAGAMKVMLHYRDGAPILKGLHTQMVSY